MNQCDVHRVQLDDVAAGAAANAALASHLRACAACADTLERKRALLARVDAAAKSWMTVAPPARLAGRIMAAAREHAAQRAQSPWWFDLRVLRAAGMVALAAALVFGAYESMRLARPPAAVMTPAAQSVLTWRSPTSRLLDNADSVLDIRSPGRLLDTPALPGSGWRSGENHAV